MYRVLYLPTSEYIKWNIYKWDDPLARTTINFKTYDEAAKILLYTADSSFYRIFNPLGSVVTIDRHALYQMIVPYSEYAIVKIEDV